MLRMDGVVMNQQEREKWVVPRFPECRPWGHRKGAGWLGGHGGKKMLLPDGLHFLCRVRANVVL